MTNNQIKLKELRETERANLEKEAENRKSRASRENIADKDRDVNKQRNLISSEKNWLRFGGDLMKLAGALNHLEWYNKTPELTKDTSTVSFNTSLGSKIYPIVHTSAAGFRVYRTFNTYGPATGGASNTILDKLSQKLMAYMRIWNTAQTVYDAPDLVQYLVGFDSCVSWHAVMMKVYGILNTRSVYNRFYARPMVRALGFDYDDLVDNMPAFRKVINLFAKDVNAFAIPNVFTFFQRHYWLYVNVFTDNKLKKAQSFSYMPVTLLGYNWATARCSPIHEFPGSISFPAKGTNITLANIQSICKALLSNYYSNTDVAYISGDVLKAFGDSLLTLPEVPQDYATTPICVDETLQQTMNLTTPTHTMVQDCLFSGFKNANDYNGVAQTNYNALYECWQTGTGVVQFSLHAHFNATQMNNDEEYNECRFINQYAANGIFYNSYRDSDSPEDVMVASRLMAVWKGLTTPYKNQSYTIVLTAAGSEVVAWWEDWFLGSNGNGDAQVDFITQWMSDVWWFDDAGADLEMMFYNPISTTLQYDWNPIIFIERDVSSSEAYVDAVQEIGNPSCFTETHLNNIHEVALYSEFGLGDIERGIAYKKSGNFSDSKRRTK